MGADHLGQRGGLINVAVNLVLIPRYGMFGAAWATLIAYLLHVPDRARALGAPESRHYENRNLAVLVAIYGVALAASIGLVEVRLPVVIDLLVKAALAPFLFGILFIFRVATLAEMRAALRRPKRRRPLTESDEAEMAARQAEEVAGMTDDTGFAPDNRA